MPTTNLGIQNEIDNRLESLAISFFLNTPTRIRFQECCTSRLFEADFTERKWNRRLQPGQRYISVISSDLNPGGDYIPRLVPPGGDVNVLCRLAGKLDVVSTDVMLEIRSSSFSTTTISREDLSQNRRCGEAQDGGKYQLISTDHFHEGICGLSVHGLLTILVQETIGLFIWNEIPVRCRIIANREW